MSCRKSLFLWEEHTRMAKLKHELESAHRESQDRAVEVNEAWAVELVAAEWAIAAKRGHKVAKAHQAETEVEL